MRILSEGIAVSFDCPKGDAGKVLCAMVPPLPTYNVVGVQVEILSGDGWEREKSPKDPTCERNDEVGKCCAQCGREFGVRVIHPLTMHVFALESVIALRCEWQDVAKSHELSSSTSNWQASTP